MLLGPNTLARVTVTKGYTRVGGSKLGYWKSSHTGRNLASLAVLLWAWQTKRPG